ncbi:DUF2971 domain-containing protein [Rhizobium leguminosarum]|uniref:DUF2971 domain-containing protein n=1 Tax=Rhizobium leguminosarum TaxID=384 RepID=UPI003F976B54
MNDPFDFLGVAVNTTEQRRDLDKTRQGLNVAFGLLCMSTTWQEPLLWSHYADKHKGMCLGFDVDDTHWEPVRYRAARPSLNYYSVSDFTELSDDALTDIRLTKFNAWRYEREYRLNVEIKNPQSPGLHWVLYSDKMALKQVIVGPRTSASRETIERVVSTTGSDVEIFKARVAFKSFKVIKQRDNRLWK